MQRTSGHQWGEPPTAHREHPTATLTFATTADMLHTLFSWQCLNYKTH